LGDWYFIGCGLYEFALKYICDEQAIIVRMWFFCVFINTDFYIRVAGILLVALGCFYQ